MPLEGVSQLLATPQVPKTTTPKTAKSVQSETPKIKQTLVFKTPKTTAKTPKATGKSVKKSLAGKTPKSAKKSAKPLWSEVVRRNLNKPIVSKVVKRSTVKQTVKPKAAVKQVVSNKRSAATLALSPDIVIGKKVTKTPAKLTKKGRKTAVRIFNIQLLI